MKTLTKPHATKTLRMHFKVSNHKTLCGIWLDTAQETILDCDCQRCLKCQRAASRPRRSRLNGRKVSKSQIPLI